MSFLSTATRLLTSEAGRIVATILVIGGAAVLQSLAVRFFSRIGVQDTQERRGRIVVLKNCIAFFAVLAVGTIWATMIAGVALSLAAFAGAFVLAIKELILCGVGYLLFAVSRPYRVGDEVEIGSFRGRVSDVNIFSTSLHETGTSQELTGKVLSFPNSMLLSLPIRNVALTAAFGVTALRIALPYAVDRIAAEAAAREAADLICRPWQDEAGRALRDLEEQASVDLPDAQATVLWETCDVKMHWMVLRIAVPNGRRMRVEQAVLAEFWRIAGSRITGQAARGGAE